MTDHISALERLQKLRQEGAITDVEFEQEKLLLLRGPRSHRGWLLWLWAAIAASALAAIGVFLFVLPRNSESRQPVAAASRQAIASVQPEQAPPVMASIRDRPPAEQLATAFQVAFGRSARSTLTVEGDVLTFRPGRLLWVGDWAILISPGKNRETCHACAGALAIHYLKPSRDTFEVIGAWPRAVRGWGWGEAPTDWSISNRFTSNPAIFAEGGFMGQGVVCESATITELRPEGPIESAPIRTGYSNGGFITHEMLAEGERAEELNGAIVNVQRDRSFDVRFTGTSLFTQRYVRRGSRFVPAARSRILC